MIMVTVNTREVEAQLKQLGADACMTASDVLRNMMGEMGSSLIKATPPSKKAINSIIENSGSGGSPYNMSDRKIGEGAIAKDINKIIKPLDFSKEQWGVMKNFGVQAYVFRSKAGKPFAIDQDHYMSNPSNQTLEAHHNRHRGKNGRVTTARGGNPSGRNSMDIGRWKGVTWIHTKRSVQDRYVKFKQKHAGKLKAGWNYMVAMFNGRTPPTWISRHGMGGGTAGDFLKRAIFSGYLIGINKMPYADIIASKGIDTYVERITQKQIDKRLGFAIQRAIDKYNGKRATKFEKAA